MFGVPRSDTWSSYELVDRSENPLMRGGKGKSACDHGEGKRENVWHLLLSVPLHAKTDRAHGAHEKWPMSVRDGMPPFPATQAPVSMSNAA